MAAKAKSHSKRDKKKKKIEERDITGLNVAVHGRTTMLLTDNVIDLTAVESIGFVNQAVFTKTLRPFADESAKF